MAESPLIIPIFLPHLGCREHCLFCNQRATAPEIPSPPSVRKFIEASLSTFPTDKKNRERQIAFYGGSFTAMHKEDQVSYIKEVQPFLSSGLINSVRISTRPDALDEEVLCLLKRYGVKTVEIGAQSMVDQVLLLSHRGHRAEDTVSAISRLRLWGFEVGLHLMIGLPGDTLDHFLQTLDQVIHLRPDFIRVHPTLVLRGAPLEILWRNGEYSPLSLEDAIQWLKKGVLKLERASIPVGRIGLHPTKELEEYLIAGPYHPALHHLIDSAISFDLAVYLLQRFSEESQPIFLSHPKEISNLRGQRNGNILRLKDQFHLKDIFVQEEEDIPKGSLLLQTQTGNVSIHRREFEYNGSFQIRKS